MRKLTSVGVVFLMMLFLLQASAQEKSPKKVFAYGGVATCKACHMTAKSGAQYKIWSAGPHAKTFETLKSEAALAIAKEKGIKDPSTSEKCVKCHVTAFGVDEKLREAKLTLEEGVSCEACHGPGSVYKKRAIITGIYEGKLDAAEHGLIKPVTEKVCMTCHNAESPTFKEFNFEKMLAKIAHPVPKNE